METLFIVLAYVAGMFAGWLAGSLMGLREEYPVEDYTIEERDGMLYIVPRTFRPTSV